MDVAMTEYRTGAVADTGLDYFGARYYSGAQGRFTSPDEFPGGIVDPFTGQQISQPGPLPYADITDPQTLNKYAYVRNNPLRYTDPDGHCTDVLTCTLWVGEALGYGTAAVGGALGGLAVWLGSPAVPGAIPSPNPGHQFAMSYDAARTGTADAYARNSNENYVPPAKQQGQQSTPSNPNGQFEPSPKHGPEKCGDVSAGPKDGQTALDNSTQVKGTSPRRVGVDKANGQIVVLDQTSKGQFHGHVRSWSELSDQQRNALTKAKLVDKRGNIL